MLQKTWSCKITLYLIFYTFSETSLCYCICIFLFPTGSVLLFVFFPFCICICFQQVRYYVEHCSLGDWLVLYQMARNMNKRFFAEFLYVLARFHSRSYQHLIQRHDDCLPVIRKVNPHEEGDSEGGKETIQIQIQKRKEYKVWYKYNFIQRQGNTQDNAGRGRRIRESFHWNLRTNGLWKNLHGFHLLSSSFFKPNDFIHSKYFKILVSSVFRKFQDLTISTPPRLTILTSRWLTTITTRNRKNQSSQTLMLLTFLPRDKLCVCVCLEMFSMFDV